MQAFREFKAIWDPDWKMNPGKLVEPYRMDENLRLGADYRSVAAARRISSFPHDHGSLAAQPYDVLESGNAAATKAE